MKFDIIHDVYFNVYFIMYNVMFKNIESPSNTSLEDSRFEELKL
jgi:hypothetical protein